VGIDGAPLRKYKYFSTSSSEYVEVPAGHPAWSRWSGWAKERVLGSYLGGVSNLLELN
jgi:hypothetical protein